MTDPTWWTSVGALVPEAVSLTEVAMPLVTPFVTARGVEAERRFWLVGVHAGGITGWAESVAQGEPLYSEETHQTVHLVVVEHLLPRLFQAPLDGPEAVAARFRPIRHHEMAKAALEMAVFDWYARAAGVSLHTVWGGTRAEVAAGVALGLTPTVEELLAAADPFVAAGYRRLKVKIQRGWDFEPLAALRRAYPGMAIMADGNSAYTLLDQKALMRLDDLDLLMLEQPLGPDDLVDHAVLQRALKTPICLDESLRSVQDAQHALSLASGRVFNIKPGRVGGFRSAVAIHDVARAAGVDVWCGGMLESGIGRAANLQLASLPGFTLPSDLSASSRYFVEDLIDPPFVLTERGTLAVPRGPGIGVTPDAARVRRFATQGTEWHRPG